MKLPNKQEEKDRKEKTCQRSLTLFLSLFPFGHSLQVRFASARSSTGKNTFYGL